MKVFTGYNLPVHNRYSHSYTSKRDSLCFKSLDLLDMPEKDIFERVKASIQQDNFLGKGTEAVVYRIKDTDYCVRILYEMLNESWFKYSQELTPADKVNHIVAKLGFGTSILRFFKGVTLHKYIDNPSARLKLQEKIAEMPLKSYTGLLHQIAEATDNEMLFDSYPGNLIVDVDKQKLTAIDFYPMSENPRDLKPLTEMYSILTSYGSEEKTGKKIFDKIVDAALEEFKPNKIPCMDTALFDFVELALKRYSDNIGHKQGNLSESIDKFLHLKGSIALCAKDIRQLKKTEIRYKTMLPELTKRVTEIKNLMTRIH